MSFDFQGALQQMEDTDEEGWLPPSIFWKRAGSLPPSLGINLEQWISSDPSPSTSPQLDFWASARTRRPHVQVSRSLLPLHAPIRQFTLFPFATTALEQPLHRNITPRINSEHDSWVSASRQIPPELFDNILFYVCLDNRWAGAGDTLDSLNADDRSLSKNVLSRNATTCSLVCLHWANRCRQWLFRNKRLKICSFEEAQTLIRYATQGCASLVPVHKLIESIWVEQRYDRRQSFCDRLYMLKVKLGVRLSELNLIGPVPHGFPPCKLDTPHWSLPPSVATPPSLLPYGVIRVINAHLPSMKHVSKYVRHFVRSLNIHLEGMTWDTDGQEPQLHLYRRGSHKVEGESFQVSASKCTDNFYLCLLVATVHPHWQSLMSMLPDDETQWIAVTMRWSREFVVGNPMCRLTISPEEPKGLGPISVFGADLSLPDQACKLYFRLHGIPGEDSSSSALETHWHVVSVSWDVDGAEEEADIGSLRAYLANFPMLRVVFLTFYSYKGLLAAMRRHRPVPFNQNCTYVFTYWRCANNEFPEVPRAEYSGSSDRVEIDPITLSPTGRRWVDYFDLEPELIQEYL
ncbi:hypothetical protein BDY19DRAFT_711092 [Irpex rosettiformis]|uniref:Uncharacterized protein n=1 Tax=Irpex rosettiformis TaxID=378272 RepID=A0ACB8TMI8_9APHY|nr:hypothetical protein BDY19DRAFT_711092 [Irpex rosettiformis]